MNIRTYAPTWVEDVPRAVLALGTLFLVLGVAYILVAAGQDPSPERGMVGLVGFAWVFGILVLWRWAAASTRLHRLRDGIRTS